MKKGPIVAGIACGIVCAVCVFSYAQMVRGEADSARAEAMERYGGEQVEVLVATKDIYPGETLDSSNSTVRTWLSDLLPDECVSSLSDVKGLQVASMIVKGEAVTKHRFDAGSTSIDVPEGCVALSVSAQDVQAVGGSLKAGSLVDVYATGTQTSRIGQNILVLATNVENADSTKTKVSWVTLAVPAEQSQEFVTASQSMDIYFVLPAKGNSSSESDSVGASAGKSDSQSGVASSGNAAEKVSGSSASNGGAQTGDSAASAMQLGTLGSGNESVSAAGEAGQQEGNGSSATSAG